MKQAFVLLLAAMTLFQVGYRIVGYQPVYEIGYGAITLMAVMISLTFLWLWLVRATPLALGMAYSWAGTGCVLGWWWMYNATGQPEWATQSPILFSFLSLYIVGAILHFAVIHRSFGLHGLAFLVPVLGALAVSGALFAIG